jgi:hypothetical protein
VDCPYSFGDLLALKWVGSPQERINFIADGRSLTAGADTASDLDLISWECAQRRGFKIDTSESARTRVLLADEMIVETSGESAFPLLGSPNSTASVCLSTSCLAFLATLFLAKSSWSKWMHSTLATWYVWTRMFFIACVLRSTLGPIQAFLTRKWASKTSDTVQQEHDKAIEAEIYRRNKANRALAKIKDGIRAAAASKAEEAKRRAFDAGHSTCMHCIGTTEGGEPSGE